MRYKFIDSAIPIFSSKNPNFVVSAKFKNLKSLIIVSENFIKLIWTFWTHIENIHTITIMLFSAVIVSVQLENHSGLNGVRKCYIYIKKMLFNFHRKKNNKTIVKQFRWINIEILLKHITKVYLKIIKGIYLSILKQSLL